MSTKRFGEFGGAPLLYDRRPASNYGITGIPSRPYVDLDFAADVDRAFTHLFRSISAVGMGEVKAILFGGVGRTGTGSSLHHSNRAFDLDGLLLSQADNWVADTFEYRPMIYLGIEAVLRQYFGTVLAYDYNKAHEDHFHFDNGRPIGWNSFSKSRVLFLQNSFRYLFDEVLRVDGVYGPETASVERRVRAELGLGGFSKLNNWVSYLETCVDIAFRREVDTTASNLMVADTAAHSG